MSLRTRALVAVSLMIGFYVLALSVAGGLLWAVYAQWAYLDRVNGRITLFCVVGAGVILWSIMPRIDHFEPPGPRIDPAQQPRLFKELESIAASTGQQMPRDVFLVPEVNAWVAQRGGVMGFGSHRVMALGVPLMALLTVSQFRAVLAHEFGHFHGGDTKLGPWIYKTRAAIGRTLIELSRRSSLLVVLFRWYGDMFLRVTLAISRAQEYAADRLAAQAVGARAMVEGLKQIHRGAVAWDSYLQMEVAPVVAEGFSPPLGQGFAHFLQAPQVSKPVEQMLATELSDGKADPMDTHPALPERIAALKNLPAGAAEDNRMSTELLDHFTEADTALFLTQGGPLRPLSWDEALRQIWIPGWRKQIEREAEALRGLTVAQMGKALRSGEIGSKIKNPGGNFPSIEERAKMAQAAAACAFALVLLQDGWIFHMLPGESYCEKNGLRLEPFQTVPQIAKGEMPLERWEETCTQLGIGALQLIQ